jgi:adenine/guanine/hypoxanthine permease
MPDDHGLLFVNGTLMRGLELHDNLAGATFLEETRTAPVYRVFSIRDRHPGMFRVDADGVAVAGELYDVPRPVLDLVIEREPPGLYVDEVELEGGRVVPGVLYREELVDGSCTDISSYGGWRGYMSRGAEAAE